jgi:hypothetical protein
MVGLVFSMSSGVRELGENRESCSKGATLRESGASLIGKGTGSEGGEIRRHPKGRYDGILAGGEASGREEISR